MFHLTLKLKLLEKSRCKSTAFCNLYVTYSDLFSSDLFIWHFSGKKKKKNREWEAKNFQASPTSLPTSTGSPTLDSKMFI